MRQPKPMLAYDSSEHLFQARGIRVPHRSGCPLVLPARRAVVADAALPRTGATPLSEADRADMLAMFPNAFRLGR